MMRTMRGLGVAIAVVMVSAVPAASQDALFTWRGEMDGGQRLEVRGISGNITATLAAGSTAEVLAEKFGREKDFPQVNIVLVEEDGQIIICAVYGEVRNRDSCDSRGDHDRGGRRSRSIDVSVDFEVRVPAGVEFVGRTVSGDVDADDLESDVDAGTVSGDVWVSTTGVARASTVSGDLNIRMGSLSWDELHFNTVSGSINVTVPEGLDAEVEFSSLSGDFRTDFELNVRRSRDRFVGSEVQGVIGEGRRALTFKTVSGDVSLRRGRSGTR